MLKRSSKAILKKRTRHRLATIKFKKNSNTITKDSYKALKAIAEILREKPEMRLKIIGHTDNVGDQEHHKNLSLKRSESIRNFLMVRQKINNNRLECVGMGHAEPIESNDTESGRAANRRVEFEVIK